MITDQYYQDCIRQIYHYGDELESRNYRCRSVFDLQPITFYHTPLVTLRKTAWKMALREMEWFMSGDPKCPDKLLPWWSEQLADDGRYRRGYSEQFRHSSSDYQLSGFDQIEYILNGLRTNPNSRRLILTSWNPYEMARITALNQNEKTPTTCHSSFVQFFVRNRRLYMTSYQRSADILLGVPHNWIQSWALFLYLARHAGLLTGTMRWIFGDAHCYLHPSHIATIEALLKCDPTLQLDNTFNLVYNKNTEAEGVPEFRASDFVMDGTIPEPFVTTKPILL